MSSTMSPVTMNTGTRRCVGCGARLARDNTTSRCSPCGTVDRDDNCDAPHLGAEFWHSDVMCDALASKDMGVVVRTYRRHPAHGRTPLAQVDVARWLGINQGQLSRIESGRNRVRDIDKLAHYAQVLRIPSELLWFETDDDNDPPKDHSLVRLPGGPAVPAATARTDTALAESLLITLRQYATTDNLTGPHSLLPIAEQQLRFAEHHLASSRGRGHARMLYVTSRFAEFIGWLHQDAGDLQAAMQWSNRGLDFAQEADDARLISYIQMRKSNIASDARKPDLAVTFARAALQNSGALTPRLRAVALRAEAHGHALAGNPDGCSRALDSAFRYAADAAESDEADIARYCTPSYIEMEAAHCWIELGKPATAIATLQQGLAEWQPNFRRDLGLCLARLAVAHAGSGQPDEASAVAQHALDIAADTHSNRTTRQLHRAASLLEATAPDHAQQLRHTLRTRLR
jgi:transcriptional regulator with XRE-family HTH domain